MSTNKRGAGLSMCLMQLPDGNFTGGCGRAKQAGRPASHMIGVTSMPLQPAALLMHSCS